MIEPLTLMRASRVLADRIRELILGGTFVSGTMLPAERDLVTDSGISRGSVREALKILETEGLVEIRTGRSGGALVTAPTPELLTRSVQVFVRANTVDLKTLLECRVAIEPSLARLAAENATAEQVAEIRRFHLKAEETIDDVVRYRPANFAFHMAIAKAAQNEPLAAFMEAISGPVLEERGFAKMTDPQTRRAAVKEHEQILQAIERHDGDEAARLMQDHLGFYSRKLKG